MRFWWRELAGWVLMALGLVVFGICIAVLVVEFPARLFEAGPLVVIGIFLFRGGIHLLKVAVAARICLEAADADKRGGEVVRSWGGGRKAVTTSPPHHLTTPIPLPGTTGRRR